MFVTLLKSQWHTYFITVFCHTKPFLFASFTLPWSCWFRFSQSVNIRVVWSWCDFVSTPLPLLLTAFTTLLLANTLAHHTRTRTPTPTARTHHTGIPRATLFVFLDSHERHTRIEIETTKMVRRKTDAAAVAAMP